MDFPLMMDYAWYGLGLCAGWAARNFLQVTRSDSNAHDVRVPIPYTLLERLADDQNIEAFERKDPSTGELTRYSVHKMLTELKEREST